MCNCKFKSFPGLNCQFFLSVIDVASSSLQIVGGLTLAVPVFRVLYCTSTNARNMLLQLVRCVILSLEQHIHCHSRRLLSFARLWYALVCAMMWPV